MAYILTGLILFAIGALIIVCVSFYKLEEKFIKTNAEVDAMYKYCKKVDMKCNDITYKLIDIHENINKLGTLLISLKGKDNL